MIAFKKKIISLIASVSGLFVLCFLYPILTFILVDYVSISHGKPDLTIVMILLLTNFVIFGDIFIIGRVFNFAKSTKKKMLVAGTIISLFTTWYFGYGLYQNVINWSFTTEKWKSNPNERVYMVDELFEKVELYGKNYEEVENLLGKPDERKDDVLVYYLGPEKGIFSIKVMLLTLRIDQYGMVSGYGVSLH